jgi:uncharacterized membrane protein YhaH (DUF805 family)
MIFLPFKYQYMNTYFTFEGRIRRTHYGLRLMLTTIISFLTGIAWAIVDEPFFKLVLFLPFVMITWFNIASATKRCHDLDHNGWWQLIPFYGIALLFFEGTRGDNKYGPDPKRANALPIRSVTGPEPQPSAGAGYRRNTYDGADNGKQAASSNYAVNTPPKQDPGYSGGYRKGSLYE